MRDTRIVRHAQFTARVTLSRVDKNAMQSLHGIELRDRLLLTPHKRATGAAHRTRAEQRTRIALAATSGGCTFLSAHMLLHAMHVAKADFQLLAALSPIPLFATILASTLVACIAAALTALLSDDPAALLARM